MTESNISVAEMSARISAMSMEQRRLRRRECLGQVLDCIAYLAADVASLDPGSEELEDFYNLFGQTFTDKLVLVGNGQFLPELMHKFYASNRKLNLVSGMPITVQRKIAAGDTFDFVVVGPDGKQDKRQAAVDKLKDYEIQQLLARDHVRTEAEQVAWLDRKRRKAIEPIPDKVGRIRIDRDRCVAIFPSRGEYPLHELLEVVKLLQK